jgi:hypothetical protein
MRAGVIHVIATARNRGQCNAHAHHVHVRRSLVLGNPGRRAQIVFPWLKSLELPQLFVSSNSEKAPTQTSYAGSAGEVSGRDIRLFISATSQEHEPHLTMHVTAFTLEFTQADCMTAVPSGIDLVHLFTSLKRSRVPDGKSLSWSCG